MKFLNHITNDDDTTYNVMCFMHCLHDMSCATNNFMFWSLLCICIGEIRNLNLVFVETYENKVFSDISQLSMLQKIYELNE